MHAGTPPRRPGWYVISLRPRGEHAALRRGAARRGGGLIALSPWRLQVRDDDRTRAALRAALAAPRVLFTSPTAVRAAQALQPLRRRAGQRWFAVGAGSAAALHRAGIDAVQAPARMDSEGLLALPDLADLRDSTLGFVSAPGGRGLLVPTLQARGARVLRADVYDRVPVPPSPRAVAQLRALVAPATLALSSGEALQVVLAALPTDAAAALRQARVVAASQRLAALAREHGFGEVVIASGPRPRDLLAAAGRP
ncbi:uroporphyrinogen-III synthase [Lysobacter cavernae]|uniref:Uroporphyrinogen-III synthase n=1 Tax=Lysobacter cavernae TaxID=1685901 RepID=A0ABV7RSY1_9GAMM